MKSFKKYLQENIITGVTEREGAIFFYPNFEEISYKGINFNYSIPSFSSLKDVNIDEPEDEVDSSGIILVEPDNRIWIRKVANNYGGYIYSFAKGRLEKGLSIQQNAIKETFEELGLVSKITDWVVDISGDTTLTRFYVGSRIGGHPSYLDKQNFKETEYIVLATMDEANKLLNKTRDKQILKALRSL